MRHRPILFVLAAVLSACSAPRLRAAEPAPLPALTPHEKIVEQLPEPFRRHLAMSHDEHRKRPST